MNKLPELNEIGQINYTWNFDIDDYVEFLDDNNLEDQRDNYILYIKDNVDFELEFFDNEYYRSFYSTFTDFQRIEDKYGELIANKILSDCMKSGGGSLETFLYVDDIDVNNDAEVNKVAKKLFNSSDYIKDGRGWILSDGDCIYTYSEHNMVTRIPGIKSTYHFLKLGNIRFLQASVDIGKEPTYEQYRTLREIIASYQDKMFYLDITDHGEHCASYFNPNVNYVINEIKRYFRDGIFPQGNN